nr:N-formylglutamate amidohydrolase [Polymorphum gilvum]
MIVVQERTAPLLLSIPHSGSRIPPAIERRMTATGRLQTDLAWHVDSLFEFAADMDVTVVRTPVSPLVIDVDADPASASAPDGGLAPALCALETLDGKRLYQPEEDPGPVEIEERRRLFHAPYHDALAQQVARLRAMHRRIVVLDAQSMRSRIKGVFDGELPLFTVGTRHGRSCHEDVAAILADTGHDLPGASHAENDLFPGGWIVRSYGRPQEGIHAAALTIAQRAYLKHETPPFEPDKEKARRLKAALRQTLLALIGWARGEAAAPARELLGPLPDMMIR